MVIILNVGISVLVLLFCMFGIFYVTWLSERREELAELNELYRCEDCNKLFRKHFYDYCFQNDKELRELVGKSRLKICPYCKYKNYGPILSGGNIELENDTRETRVYLPRLKLWQYLALRHGRLKGQKIIADNETNRALKRTLVDYECKEGREWIKK